MALALALSSSHTTITAGTTHTLTISVTGATANSVVMVGIWGQSPALMNNVEMQLQQVSVATNSAGAGTASVQNIDTNATPRGTYTYRLKSGDTVSTAITLIFGEGTAVPSPTPSPAPGTGTPAPTASPTPSPTPAPGGATTGGILLTATTDRATIQAGQTTTFSYSLVNALPLAEYTANSFIKINGGTAVNTGKTTIQTDANGRYSNNTMATDNAALPRGTYEYWVEITRTGIEVKSNVVTVVYASGSANTAPPAISTNQKTTLTMGMTNVPYGSGLSWVVNIDNAVPNNTFTVELYSQSVSAGSVAARRATIYVTTNAQGSGFTQWLEQNNALVMTAGTYTCWATVLTSTTSVRSTDSTVIYQAASTGTTPTPAPSEISQKFVGAGQLSQDVLASIKKEDSTGVQVAQQLKRIQSCNYDTALTASIQSAQPDSLGVYIRENLRNNVSDDTKLKSIRRHYFNPASLDKGVSLRAFAAVDSLSQDVPLGVLEDTVTYYSTQPAGFTVEDNKRFVFTKKARYGLYMDLNVGLWSGQGPIQSQILTPIWKNGNSANHEVTFSIYLQVTGSLSGGVDVYTLPLLSGYILQQDVIDKYTQRVSAFFPFSAVDGDAPLGSIQKMNVILRRSSWVATYDGVTERLGFFKTTDAGVNDTSNYIELIEL